MNQTAEDLAHKAGQPELRIVKRFERGFFGAAKSVAVTATLTTKRPLPLGDILFRLGRSAHFHLQGVLAQPLPSQLTNMRGRPLETFGTLREPPAEGEEELLFVNGRVINTSTEGEETAEPFAVRLRTKFLRFEGAKQIVYGLSSDIHFPFGEPAPEPAAFLGYSMPLEISELRLGFELFYARFMGSFLGIAPVIKTRFYLDASPLALKLFIEGEQDRAFPQALEGDLSALSDVLQRNGIDVDLVETLRAAE